MMTTRQWSLGFLAGLFLLVVSWAPVAALVDQQYFVSENNKLYFVVKVDDSGSPSIGAQITSLMMTSGTPNSLNETANNPPDPVVTSVSILLSGGILQYPPLSNIKRTVVMTGFSSNDIIPSDPNPANGLFDPLANGGDGLLTLPGGLRTVTFDGTGTEPVVAVTTASAGVPAAVRAFQGP